MRKTIKVCFLLLLTLLLPVTALAHSGGTDSSGGHTDHSTGEYHYHHGYPAHDHYDMDGDGVIDCPYDFDDKTGNSSGSSSNSVKKPVQNTTGNSRQPEYESEPEPEATPEPVQKNYEHIPVLCAIFLIIGSILVIKSKRDKKRKALEEAERIRKEHEQWLAEKAEYTKKYGGKSLLELAGAPPNCYVGNDGLPACDDGTDRWGDSYTFYVSGSGRAFHRKSCRYADGIFPTNAYHLLSKYIRNPKHPCSICKPSLPDLTWYEEYLRIKAIKDKYQID